MSDLPDDEIMTPAELKVVREFLGLTTLWLAQHLEVQERTVHRWEAGVSPVPEGVRLQIEHLETLTAQTVTAAIDHLMDVRPSVYTYRTDADYQAWEPDAKWPASWHRAVVARVAQETPGLEIHYRTT